MRLLFIIERITKIWLMVVLMMTLLLNESFAQSAEGKGSPEPLNQRSPGKGEGTSEVELNRDYLKGYIADTEYILTSPSRWEKSDWLKASLVAGATIGLYAYDHDIQEWAQKKRNSTTNNVARLADSFGNELVTLPVLGAFYLYGYSLEDKKARTTALLGLESFLISSVFTQAIKFTAHRHRPSEGNQYDKWEGPSFTTSNLSFPSWESSSAFAIGTVIASEYHDNAWIPPLAYGIATLTALSRVNDNDHWASDVFFGSAIGFFTAKAIVVLHKKGVNIAVIPVIDGQLRALLISYKF
jgi:membrane-associated phospholipid phosphatase